MTREKLLINTFPNNVRDCSLECQLDSVKKITLKKLYNIKYDLI